MLDAFYEAGGNFIDVANLYHDGDSEEWIGEWMELRGVRDKIVLATKYTGNNGREKDANSMGNHIKSMSLSVRDSLKRLRTDYIDIFYVHFWQVKRSAAQSHADLREYTTSVEEVMRGLHKHVMKGDILYPAVSDTPAWVRRVSARNPRRETAMLSSQIVASANAFARYNSLSPFVLYQGLWSLSERELEQEVIRQSSL